MLHASRGVRCALHVEDYQGRDMKTENGFHISYAEVTEAADEILREFGSSYVYRSCPTNGCSYVHSGEVTVSGELKKEDVPGCIVGQILFRLGVPLASMKQYGSLTEYTRGRMLQEKGIELTDMAFDFLTTVQYFQDQGSNGWIAVAWGEAVRHADGIVSRYRYSFTEERVSWSHDSFNDGE